MTDLSELLALFADEIPEPKTPEPPAPRKRGPRWCPSRAERDWAAARIVAGGIAARMGYRHSIELAAKELIIGEALTEKIYLRSKANTVGPDDLIGVMAEPAEIIEYLRAKHGMR